MSFNINNSQLRNERKFIFFEPHSSIEKLLNSIGAKEIYSPRNINSIYFDTCFHRNFYEAIDGIMLRSKVRVRWYGEIFNVEIEPQLESKNRINQHNYKITNKLESFKTKKLFNLIDFNKYVQNQKKRKDEINYYLNNLYPNLFVSYIRSYYIFDNVRITLDTDLKFINLAKVNLFSKKNLLCINKKKIIELKYGDEFHKKATKITKTFNNRLNKFSKYQIGISETFF